jgi:hypothetical protein
MILRMAWDMAGRTFTPTFDKAGAQEEEMKHRALRILIINNKADSNCSTVLRNSDLMLRFRP